VLLLLVAAGIAPLFRPLAGEHKQVNVTIPPGTSVAGIGEILERHGIVRSGWAFGIYARLRGDASKLKAGTFRLSGDMSLGQIAQELRLAGAGFGDRVHVSVPEGYTLKQIAAALQQHGVCDAAEFLKIATTPDVIAQIHADFPLPHDSLEGYLYPDTYMLKPHTAPLQVIDGMLLNFSNRFVRPYQHQIDQSGESLHNIVTIASLVEREAKVPQDRARIAGVIVNRLKRGMKLEVDATVLYALGHHKDKVLYRDLEVKSPYNTYRHAGLPPGPIANPGLPCLEAALSPEKNDFIYYVAQPNGAHLFSRTPEEHQAAKREVRLERSQARGAENGD
jgi:UPF0755 protein